MALHPNNAIRVGDWFLGSIDRASGESMTHLKLQKLVYYAQAWSLANFNQPLFSEDFQAWTHGPVAPSLWNHYKDRGWDAIPAPKIVPLITNEHDRVLPAVLEAYGKFAAKFLEDLTHSEAPWKETRGNLPIQARCTKAIPKKLMRDFYAKKIKKSWSAPIITAG